MIRKNVFICLSLTIFLYSCHVSEKAESTDVVYTVSFGETLNEAFNGSYHTASLSEIGGSISYVPLEVNSQTLFRKLYGILIQDSFIYINMVDRVLQFDMSGKYVRSIGKRGKGPEEFKGLNDFFVDDTICCILDSGKGVIYNNKGTFLRSFKLDSLRSIGPRQMLLMNDHNVVFRYRLSRVDTSVINLFVTDPEFKVRRIFRNNHKRNAGFMYPVVELPMYTFQGNIRFKEMGVDTLYSVTVDSLIPYALFDLGDREFPSVIQGDQSTISALSYDKAALTQIFEDNHHFYMRFDSQKEPKSEQPGGISIAGSSTSYMYGMYSKQSGEVKILKNTGFQNDIDGGLPFFPKYVYNDSILVDWVDAFKLSDQLLNADEAAMRKKYGQKYDDLVRVVKGMKDEGGTVLVLVQP